MAGLFFPENGRIHGESSYLEFPFRRKELGGGSARPERNRTEFREEEQEESQETPVQLGEPVTSISPLAAAVANPQVEEREASSTLLTPPKLKRGNVWIPLSFIFLILGVLLGFQSALSTKSSVPAAPTEDPYLLDLTAKKEGDTLHVRWSGKAPILKKARRASITIVDGDYNSTVNMDATDLQAGNLFYRHLTGLVKFRFEVFASDRTSLSEVLEYRADPNAAPAPVKK